MNEEGAVRRIVLPGLLCALLFAFSAGSVAAVVGDYLSLATVAKGATLAGRDLGGMTEAQVRGTIEQAIATPMMQPVTVNGDQKSWTLDPKNYVTVDEDAMVAQAYAPVLNATLATRLTARVTGKALPAEVKPVFAVDNAGLAGWVSQTAATVDRKPVNAVSKVVKYSIRITPAVYGATVDQTRAVETLAQTLTDDAALTSATRVASLPVDLVAPKVREKDFKRAIVVSLSQCKVRLYHGEKLVKTYSCAPGQPAWPTPKGDFHVVRKQANAPWINPHSAWSASMPDVIPGGPGNPMGDRKIGIDYPGVFLHGIPPSEYSSIGTHASHGCMRMMPSAIHDLYPRVRVGDPVYIRA